MFQWIFGKNPGKQNDRDSFYCSDTQEIAELRLCPNYMLKNASICHSRMFLA